MKTEWKCPTITFVDIKKTLTAGNSGGDLSGQTGLD